MTKRLEVRLPNEIDEILTLYCQDSGASKTGAIVMLIKTLEKRLTPESKQLLASGRKEGAASYPSRYCCCLDLFVLTFRWRSDRRQAREKQKGGRSQWIIS